MKATEAKNWCVMRIFPGFVSPWYCSPMTVTQEFYTEFVDAFRVFEGWKVLFPKEEVRMYEIHRGTNP